MTKRHQGRLRHAHEFGRGESNLLSGNLAAVGFLGNEIRLYAVPIVAGQKQTIRLQSRAATGSACVQKKPRAKPGVFKGTTGQISTWQPLEPRHRTTSRGH